MWLLIQVKLIWLAEVSKFINTMLEYYIDVFTVLIECMSYYMPMFYMGDTENRANMCYIQRPKHP